MSSAGVSRALVAAIAVLVAVLGWRLYDPGAGGGVAGRLTNQTNTGPITVSTETSSTATDDSLPTVSVEQLPPEARDTLALIEAGGPFPYDSDGVTFDNREGLLPVHESGYYHEYTLTTPGSQDRARRIVTGGSGEQYYTDDQDASFAKIVP